MAKVLRIVRLGAHSKISIWDQLYIEEALYRNSRHKSQENIGWLFLNAPGAFQKPAIVMGFSGKPERLVSEQVRRALNVPILKRFTGGGTVVVDSNTVFTSWLLGSDLLPNVRPFPRDIMQWTASFYGKVMKKVGIEGFALHGDDYCVEQRKIGGNAQAISGNKYVHHTSFLYDYDSQLMNALKMPEKQPAYRENRNHEDFIQKLKCVVPSSMSKSSNAEGIEVFLDAVERSAEEEFAKHACIEKVSLEQALSLAKTLPVKRIATRWVEPIY